MVGREAVRSLKEGLASLLWLPYAMAFLLGLGLATAGGCATTPELDTFNKRYAAVESTWQVALETATRWRSEGRLTGAQRDVVTQAVKDWKLAREAVNTALALGEEGSLTSLTGILQVLQNVLREVEGLPPAADAGAIYIAQQGVVWP